MKKKKESEDSLHIRIVWENPAGCFLRMVAGQIDGSFPAMRELPFGVVPGKAPDYTSGFLVGVVPGKVPNYTVGFLVVFPCADVVVVQVVEEKVDWACIHRLTADVWAEPVGPAVDYTALWADVEAVLAADSFALVADAVVEQAAAVADDRVCTHQAPADEPVE